MNISNFHRVVKEFLLKSLEFVLSTRCAPPASIITSSQNRNPHLQLIVDEMHSLRTAFPVIWNHDLQSVLRVYLELVRKVEGCTPVLVERWEFLFSPAECSADCPQTFVKKSSIALRSLVIASLQTPAYTEFRGQLSYSLCFDSDSLTQWPAKTKPSDLMSLPAHMFRVQSAVGSVSGKVVYLRTVPKPEVLAKQVLPQALGFRQRLVSIETEGDGREVQECKLAFGSWSSEDSPCLSAASPVLPPATHFSLRVNRVQTDSATQSVLECSLPEVLALPVPNNTSYCESSSSDEDALFEVLSVRKDSNPFSSDPSEDAKIAAFSVKCRRCVHGRLFTAPECSLPASISALKTTLNGLKTAKAQLLAKPASLPT